LTRRTAYAEEWLIAPQYNRLLSCSKNVLLRVPPDADTSGKESFRIKKKMKNEG